MSQSILNIIGGLYEPYDFDTITVSSTAIGLTSTKYNTTSQAMPLREGQYIIITVETNSIRYRIDGPAPTSSVGHILTAGSSLILLGSTPIKNFKAIAVSGDGTMMVTYLR